MGYSLWGCKEPDPTERLTRIIVAKVGGNSDVNQQALGSQICTGQLLRVKAIHGLSSWRDVPDESVSKRQ